MRLSVHYLTAMPETPAEKFHRKAEECCRKAEQAAGQADKQAWQQLADDWGKLARGAAERAGRDQAMDLR